MRLCLGARDARREGSNRHSDRNRMAIENIGKSGDFQAEYEGSIPFTRSSVFNGFRHGQTFIPTTVLLKYAI